MNAHAGDKDDIVMRYFSWLVSLELSSSLEVL